MVYNIYNKSMLLYLIFLHSTGGICLISVLKYDFFTVLVFPLGFIVIFYFKFSPMCVGKIICVVDKFLSLLTFGGDWAEEFVYVMSPSYGLSLRTDLSG